MRKNIHGWRLGVQQVRPLDEGCSGGWRVRWEEGGRVDGEYSQLPWKHVVWIGRELCVWGGGGR